MPMSTVLRWTPDEAHHCAPIATMTLEAVSRVFGMSPLLVSCWACLSGTFTDDDVKLLHGVPERQLLHAVEDFEQAVFCGKVEEDAFSPSVQDLLSAARTFHDEAALPKAMRPLTEAAATPATHNKSMMAKAARDLKEAKRIENVAKAKAKPGS